MTTAVKYILEKSIKTSVILILIIVLYVVTLIVFKVAKPDFVKNGDDYVLWYKNLSLPWRYTRALLEDDGFYNNGKYIFAGYMPETHRMFIEKNGIEMRVNIIGVETVNKVDDLNEGDEIYIEFSRSLEFYNDTFDDYFKYYVIGVE